MKKREYQYVCSRCNKDIDKKDKKCSRCGQDLTDFTKYGVSLCVLGIVAITVVTLSVFYKDQIQSFLKKGSETASEVFNDVKDVVSNTNTLTCKKSGTTDSGDKETSDMEIVYKDNKVIKVKETNITEMKDTTMVDFTISFGQLFATALNEMNGLEVKYSKENETTVKYIMSVDYEKIDIEALKTMLGDAFDENSYFSEKNITLEQFKKDNLAEYDCK